MADHDTYIIVIREKKDSQFKVVRSDNGEIDKYHGKDVAQNNLNQCAEDFGANNVDCFKKVEFKITTDTKIE